MKVYKMMLQKLHKIVVEVLKKFHMVMTTFWILSFSLYCSIKHLNISFA